MLTTFLSLMKCYYLIIPYRIFVGKDIQVMGYAFGICLFTPSQKNNTAFSGFSPGLTDPSIL